MSLLTNITHYWKLDESSGNASDSVGSVILTNNNSVAYSTGKINNGADFGSSNTNKYLGGNESVSDGGSYTINCWVKMNTELSADGQYYAFVSSANNNDSLLYSISYRQLSGVKQIQFQRLANFVTFGQQFYSVTLGTSNWYMLTLAYDSSTGYKGYVNGSQVATDTNTGAGFGGQAGGTRIGSEVGSNFAPALVDEVGTWSRQLTGTEITALYNSGNGTQWPFGTAYTIVAALGTYALTGQTIAIKKALAVALAQGSYALTGIAASLAKGYGIVASVGSYLLTGIAATLLRRGWTNESKNSASPVNQTKNAASFTNQTKNTGSWVNETKNR